jgi:hypothetical protein
LQRTGRAVALAAAAALLSPALAATLTLQPGGPPLGELLRRAASGDVIEVLPGEYRGQVGVIQGKQLTLRGVGQPRPVFVADGQSAEGKGILVVRGSEVVVENIEFRAARVRDRNGAGIRFDSGKLQIRGCRFVDNENGVLSGNDAQSELEIADSEFAAAPAGTPLPHLIYVGRIARFTLRGSRVRGGQDGHLVKSRAAVNHVLYNELIDGPNGRASYELEFPNGGLAFVVGNVIAQSESTTNPVLLAFGSEGPRGNVNEHGLYVVHNTFINAGLKPGWFVRVQRDKLAGQPVEQRLANNLFVGLGIASVAWHDALAGNFVIPSLLLRDPDTGAYGLGVDSWLRGWAVEVPAARGQSLKPSAQFTPPIGTRDLPPTLPLSPGAIQD